MHRLVAFVSVLGLLSGAVPVMSAQEPTASAPIVPGAYIVLVKNSSDPEGTAKKHGISVNHVYKQVVHGFAASLNKHQVKELEGDADVWSIEPDRIVSIAAQTMPSGINRVDADLSATALINGIDERVDADIAIIDTGIQKNHPDLNVVGGYNCTTNKTSNWADDNGHGTHVAGTAAALDNSIGVVGVAPGARLWAVKVLNRQGSGYLSWIICGIDWVTQRAATIDTANMSLGGEFTSPAMDTSIHNAVAAGVVLTAAAGNSAKDAATFSPANNPEVIAVSAIADFNGLPGGGAPATCLSEVDDTFAYFSNFGSVVDIAAPGVCILSTYKGSTYATLSGTSMAAPHVAGGAALYIASHGKPTNAAGVAALKTALLTAATSQASADGFTGDPDAFPEPLLNVGSF